MIRKLAYLASAAVLWAGAATAQEAAKPDVAKGQNIASQVCAPCHAADGNSTGPANPKLAGQFYEYLHKQLSNFKSQGGKKAERENPVMAGMVANLSDADMRDVAAYFASQKLKPAVAKSKDLAAAGQKLYRAGNAAGGVPACAGCHGPTGAGIPTEFPRIAGQFQEYTEAQLKAFRSGARANDPASMMRTVAGRLTDQEIQAIADYVAGLR
ncbi:MAG TPA: c-type cytochrome [Burkholderiales bacterium]|nr:c-type cytochrome [Burkholderiales bacterium]